MKTLMFTAATLTLLTGAAAAQQATPAPDRAGQALNRMQNGLFGGRMADRMDGRGDRGGPMLMGGGVGVLRAADANQDGVATRAEVEGLLMEEFAWRDRNGDGVIDDGDAGPIERRLAQQREARPLDPWMAPRRAGRALTDGDTDRTAAGIGERVDRLFGELDANADGQITAEEAQAQRRGRRGQPAPDAPDAPDNQ